MTRISRLLTIFVTVLAVAFLGVAAVTSATWTDWKEVATKKYPRTEISKQAEEIRKLDDRSAAIDNAQKLAVATIEADIQAITDPARGRAVQIEKMIAELEQQTHALAQDVETEARKADARLDELKLRREDIARLRGQFDELVSQRQASQAEVKRLEDLLFQAEAMLDRVERRRERLESELNSSYEGNGKKT